MLLTGAEFYFLTSVVFAKAENHKLRTSNGHIFRSLSCNFLAKTSIEPTKYELKLLACCVAKILFGTAHATSLPSHKYTLADIHDRMPSFKRAAGALRAVGCGLWAVGLQDVKDLNSQGEIHQDKKLWKPKLG